MIDHELHATWRDRLTEQRVSGLSIAAWCREQGIPEHQFHYWKKKFTLNNDVGAEQPSTVKWTPVTVTEDASDRLDSIQHHGITIQVAGASVTVQSGFDKTLFADVIKVLQTC